MAATYDAFTASPFSKFIPYTPSQPKTPRRATFKELDAYDAEWIDIDNVIKALPEHGNHSVDALAAAPIFDLTHVDEPLGSGLSHNYATGQAKSLIWTV
jgi:hypothetical protein